LQSWLGWTLMSTGDLARTLEHCTAVLDVIGDREPSRALVDCLNLQSITLSNLGRVPEAAECGRRALALARELGYRSGQADALSALGVASMYGGDLDDAARLARQAGQVPDINGTAARVCGYQLAAVLAEAGDLAAAEQACAGTLARARDAGDLNILGSVLPVMADLDLQAGRAADAAAHLREAAQIALPAGMWLTMLNVLHGCGYLCGATGRPADAITIWAASETLSQQGGLENMDTDLSARRQQEALRQARRAAGPDRARAAEQRGAAMSLATAAEYALLLTAPESLQPPASAGPGRLSRRERELVTLVAQGRTDAEIAAQLYISIRTVRSHLDRIRDKTGCRRRADLTRLALAAKLV
jgi:DNA-binding CsgD family transcriptional regulator/tetratricopeptide (TPR) repeat protein